MHIFLCPLKKKNTSPCRFQLNHCHRENKTQTHRLPTINAVLIETETYAHAQRYIHARKRNLYIHSRPPATTHTRTYIYILAVRSLLSPFSVLRFHFRLSLFRLPFFLRSRFLAPKHRSCFLFASVLFYTSTCLVVVWVFFLEREKVHWNTRRATKRNSKKRKRKMKRKSLLSTLIVGLQNKHLIDIFCVCVCVNFFFFSFIKSSLYLEQW